MERQVHSKAELEWKQALDLEKRLKACSRKRSFYDPDVRSLRKQLRDTYESLLFLEAAFASANDVEGQLWRTVFYVPIEEFRARIRRAEKEAQQHSDLVSVGGPDAAAILSKTAAAFLKFLEEASLFYKRLVMQLQSAYGDVKVRLELPPGVPLVRSCVAADSDRMQISTGSSVSRDMRTSVHRCLVFLGDLARYASQAAPKAAVAAAGSTAAANTAAKSEWTKAIGFYRMAAHVLPRSGNPHNQLAVMAFMTGEELKAAYHYARSLCVLVPFMTARENLLQLLQTNRDRYTNLCNQRQLQQEQVHGRQVLPVAQQLAELGTCYVRLCGLLFDKINQHEYPKVAKHAFEALAGFLDHPQLLQMLQRQRLYDCTPLHLIVLSIFTVHQSLGGAGTGATMHAARSAEHAANGSSHSRPVTAEVQATVSAAGKDSSSVSGFKAPVGAPSPQSPVAVAPVAGHGDAAQRCAQRGRALAMVFRTGRLLAQACTAAVNAEAAAAVASGASNGVAAAAAAGKTGATSLMVGLNVVLQWLAAQPNCAVLQAAVAIEEDVKARAKFWTAASQLLLVLSPALDLYMEQQQQGAQEQQQQQQQQHHGVMTEGGPAPAAGKCSPALTGHGVSGSIGADASYEEGALPEELELLGFEPMRSRHYWHVTDVGKHAVDETRTRARRMLAAARVVAAGLAADQQQQLAARHITTNISTNAVQQLSTASQQFIGVVAMVAASKTPAASPSVPGVAAKPASGFAAAAAAHLQRSSPQKPPQQVVRASAAHCRSGSVTFMDVDSGVPVSSGDHQHQHSPTAAARTGVLGDWEEEEEVIVFQPRASRLSSPAVDDAGLPQAADLTVGSTGAAAAAAAAAAVPTVMGNVSCLSSGNQPDPPLPQMLLAGRQPGSRVASPTRPASAVPELPAAIPEAAAAAAAAAAAVPLRADAGTHPAGRVSSSQLGKSSTGSDLGTSGAPGGLLLQGHAATALDLQQAQAASELLLARLAARPAATHARPGVGAPAGFGTTSDPTAAAAAAAAPAWMQGFLQHPAGCTSNTTAAAAGGGSGAPAVDAYTLQHGRSCEDFVTEEALLGSGLSSLLGGLGGEPAAAALPAAYTGHGMGLHSNGLQTQGHVALGTSSGLAAVTAGAAASIQSSERAQQGGMHGLHSGVLGGPVPASAACGTGVFQGGPPEALGQMQVPLGQVCPREPDCLHGLGAAVSQPGMYAAGLIDSPTVPGDGLLGVRVNGAAPMRSISCSAAAAAQASAGVTVDARKSSAPVGILRQQAAVAAAEMQLDQVLSSSFIANQQMEVTALDAAARVLSPEFKDFSLLQQHHLLQQQQQTGDTHQPPPPVEIDTTGVHPMHSRTGSWLSGSNSTTPQATTPRGAGGLSCALQQQHAALRRLSAGSASPRSAIGAERSPRALAGQHLQQAAAFHTVGDSARAGRTSAPTLHLGTANTGQQQRQQRSSIGAMFTGPELFAPSEQLPPMHRRLSSGGGGSGSLFVSSAGGGVLPEVRQGLWAPASMGLATPGPGPAAVGTLYARVPAVSASDAAGLPVANGVATSAQGDTAAFMPGVQRGQLLQAVAPGSGVDAAGAQALPVGQQQQQQVCVAAGSPEPGDGGFTLVEYLAAQQRKLQQQAGWSLDPGHDSSNGLQAAAAMGADLSAHVLLPPVDFAESQNPFG